MTSYGARLLAPFWYLTFEISHTCALADLHPRCPVSDPKRYQFGRRTDVLDDDTIVRFWRWARDHGFVGVLNWHLYNEPAASLHRIEGLLQLMQAEVPQQRSHLWTALPTVRRYASAAIEHVVHTDYRVVAPDDLDARRAAMDADGPYAQAPPVGQCGRARDFELIIDHHGNWLKCCHDWRCEEAVGNLYADDWDVLLRAYATTQPVAWHDAASFARLPRLCRGCLAVNPSLHRTALPPPGRPDLGRERA